MQAGLSYICEDDIPAILSEKCISIQYNRPQISSDPSETKVCGRQLIDFLYGYPLELEADIPPLTVITGNDLPMLTPQCLLVDAHKVCWETEPVARPFDFVDNRCRVTEQATVKCLVHPMKGGSVMSNFLVSMQ